ncbi:2'-5' RNA ligase family protein [Pseudonocardia broussonetiae]|uniref:2'-5' RNA ligase family protein n=1 Tax=Pseudonocardia broussonetiae TaxID=2736640 RepID=A0A6M6JLC5_9PSEU|nr:2'-5' RNA ligase family protein [Pseudonocardia broussonetiae]QJY47432.1 2'-5' RNA ligase family protein [Pseudonocardia broussonetiae]
MDDRPLILTLRLDPASQERFDALRRAHFPSGRNHLAAHVTLFHALPAVHADDVRADLAEATGRAPFAVEVAGLRSLGRGVAYVLRSPELDALRAALAGRWRPWLTPQDAQRFSAHVTVQNKVAPDAARALLDALTAEFVPGTARAEGLDLWRYAGGPWEFDGGYGFRPGPPD